MKLLARYAAILLLIVTCLTAPTWASTPNPDEAAISQVLKATWEKPDHPLAVKPISIVGNHAVAGWVQGERGGRALLRQTDAGWSVLLCSGDALKDATFLRDAGIETRQASQLATAVERTERDLPRATLAAFASFAGVVKMDSGHHRAAGHANATPFSLPALPYANDALAIAIDADTMAIHHDRHHKAYVDNLNGKIAAFPQLASMTLEEVLGKVSSFDAAVRNNAGGHYNHSLFWTLMAPPADTGKADEKLAARLVKDFGSQEAFIQQFSQAAGKIFGSGWAWLIVRADGSLAITTTANQDNPLMDLVAEKGYPVLALDVWEHAYYLQYQNKRADYIKAWWKVVNWNAVSVRYANAP